MRNWIDIIEEGSSVTARNIPDLAAQEAWDNLIMNTGENEGELSDFVADYEDETDRDIEFPPGVNPHERYAELKDERFVTWLRKRVCDEARQIGKEIASAITGNYIRCWRAMTAPPNWQPTPDMDFGDHWSYTRDQAIAHFGDESQPCWIIEALIPLSSVDWRDTLRLNLSREFGDENEIRKIEGSPVKIVKIKKN